MRAGLNRSVAGHAAHESHVELAPMARDHGVPERNFLAKYAGTVLERLAPAQHSPHDDFVPPSTRRAVRVLLSRHVRSWSSRFPGRLHVPPPPRN